MRFNRVLTGFTLALLLQVTAAHADYQITQVAAGLNTPWSVDFFTNGDYLVTERRGNLLRVKSDGSTSQISGTPSTYFAGQGGFFDALIRSEGDTVWVYLSYAKGTPDANGTAIYKARLKGDTLVDGSDIFWAKTLKDTPQHYGGKLAFGPNETLFVTTGDGFDYRESAQDKQSELGKVIRIKLDGSTPQDNPFKGELSERIWSYGHRNPQGLAFDPATGELYQHEHGPKGGDEINLIQRGADYGWPLATYGVNYSGALVSPFTEYKGTNQPVTYWVPSIAPSGFAVYRGEAFPDWQGDLLVGALVDREVRRLRVEAGKVTEQESLFSELGERIRDVRISPSGFIYLVTDGTDGALYRVSPK